MNILVIGTGYVGATTGLVFSEMGHKVTGLDLDKNKINKLEKGELHFFEPGLEEILKKHIDGENITFTTDPITAIKENEIIFICVGTPQDGDGSANLRYVKNVAETIGKYMNTYKVIVDKSTVPVGTAALVENWVKENQKNDIPFDVVSNPEFLKEGSALQDALNPDRIVIGSLNEKATNMMKSLYKDFTCPIIITSPKAAELIKYAANSFLALKISYMNELARLCDVLDININDIAKGIGLDRRIGKYFLQAGIGYGGSCFPKDVNALLKTAKDSQVELTILNAAVNTNKTQVNYLLKKIKKVLGKLKGKTIGILGLTFKPNTDDMREAPALKVISLLLDAGAKVKVHDPVVKIGIKNVIQSDDVYQTLKDTDAVILCTEWEMYKNLDWLKMKSLVDSPIIFDGRNMLNKETVEKIGFDYYGIGN
ncbi:UDP-glucose dehydrogenase family protein [Terrilactibacillus laevilacticus]|uniref:UDP-glucose dehydrogenase family protein n=1 Tax=Terrilactibacillus laevilacticus TaxID=1380157 RepID=UPI001147155B|nr:UDP-glucose/GDP-mannose dehydrogenase family protein [Terrilactibacillus laevilacticus]